MQENNEQNVIMVDDDYIDVVGYIISYIRALRKTWFLLILFALIGVSSLYLLNKIRKTSYYGSTVNYSVSCLSDIYTDAAMAKRLALGVSTLASTPDFQNEMAAVMGMDKIEGNCIFEAYNTESANLFTVNIYCSDINMTNEMIHAFEEVYPKWVNKFLGKCNLTVTDEAESTGEIVQGWSKKKIIMFGFLGGCALWFCLATVYILAIQRVHTDDDMLQVVNAECLGILPEVMKKKREKSKKDTVLISNSNGHVNSAYMQSLRAMRGTIEKRIKGGKKIFMVTSTLPQEGKSILTMNLALSLEHRDLNVLVIDADLRESGIMQLLQITEDTEGLSEYLDSGETMSVNFIEFGNVTILTSGNEFKEISKLRNMNRMRTLLDDIKEFYDVIFIDTPPAGTYGDAIAMSEVADEVIYLIRANYAQIRDIRKAIEPFYQSGKLGGYILNRVEKSISLPGYGNYGKRYGARYGYGKRYGYGYGSYRNYGEYYGGQAKYSQHRNYSRYRSYGSYGIEASDDQIKDSDEN